MMAPPPNATRELDDLIVQVLIAALVKEFREACQNETGTDVRMPPGKEPSKDAA
jgi:hypothetical protein